MDVIDTSVMPGDDMDPDAIAAAAKKIRSSGVKVSKTTTATHTAWSKISASYHAPEQGQLYEAMNPVKTEGETFSTDLGSAATALETFAETVRTIKAAVVKIRADVKAFEDKIADDGTIQPAGGYNPYAGGMKLRIQWNEDKGMVAEQHRLAKDINDQVDAMRTAETTCANSIADITGAAHVPTSGPKAPPAPPHIGEAQWYLTAPIDRKENCGEQVAHAVIIDQVGGAAAGLLGFVGVKFSLTTGKFGNFFTTLGDSWGGLLKLGVGSSPITPAILRKLGAGKFADESQRTFTAFLGDQVSIDPFAKDPKQRYHDQPARAWTNTIVNIASWAVPPLKAATAAKLGKVGEVAGDAAKAGDLAKAGEATRFSSAADLARALRESGSLDKLGKVGELLKTKIASRVGEASDFSHTLDDLKTPELSKYDMDAGHANPHTDSPPVRDADPGTGHEPTGTHAGDHATTDHPAGSHPDHTPAQQEHPADHASHSEDVRDQTTPHKLGASWHDFSASDAAAHSTTIDKHATALEELGKTSKTLDELARDAGTTPSRLTSDHLKKTLVELRQNASSPAELFRLDELEEAAREKIAAHVDVRDTGEAMGNSAARDVVRSLGDKVVYGLKDEVGQRGTFDGVSWNAKDKVLRFWEAKGGDHAGLGVRTVDGVRTKQGSPAYFNDILHVDPDIGTYLRDHPELVAELRDGKARMEYASVKARMDGRVRVTTFDVKPGEVDWSAFSRAVSPGK